MVRVRVRPGAAAEVAAIAEARDITVSEAYREAITAWIKKERGRR